MTRIRRLIATFVASSLCFAGLMHSAQATLIGTEEVARGQAVAPMSRTAAQARALVDATLQRADVVAGLRERGVDPAQAQARVDALSDAEVIAVAERIDSAPAGASDVLGVIVFIFVLLLITDILGFTKIFPFTRSVR
jgi:hypothetical protein